MLSSPLRVAVVTLGASAARSETVYGAVPPEMEIPRGSQVVSSLVTLVFMVNVDVVGLGRQSVAGPFTTISGECVPPELPVESTTLRRS